MILRYLAEGRLRARERLRGRMVVFTKAANARLTHFLLRSCPGDLSLFVQQPPACPNCMLRLSSFGRHSRPISSIRRTTLPFITARAAHLAVKQLPNTAIPSRPNGLRNPGLKDNTMSSSIDGKKETFGNFDLVKRVKLDYTDLLVSKWQSRVTGLSVVHLDFEGEPSQLWYMGRKV